MKTVKPYFYDDFKCIADRCTDSCCIGWEIDIDPETAEIYAQESGTLGDKLKKNIEKNAFILAQDERCPFLRSDNLCELICEKGEGYLCEICREHPRYYEFHGDYVDAGIGLCCEEACRLLFSSDKPVTFLTEGDAEAEEEIEELLETRSDIIAKIYSVGIREILHVPKEEVLDIWEEFEPFDDRWSETSRYIRENFNEIISKADEFLSHIGDRVYEYRHLAVYLLHRYFMRSLYSDPSVIMRGISVYLMTQYLWDLAVYCKTGKFDFADRTDTAKYISKQIEYSEENIEILF